MEINKLMFDAMAVQENGFLKKNGFLQSNHQAARDPMGNDNNVSKRILPIAFRSKNQSQKVFPSYVCTHQNKFSNILKTKKTFLLCENTFI